MMTTENTRTEMPEIILFAAANDMLNEWLGHRRLTRRVIEAFPEDQLFTYSIGGMRPFADMVKELLDIGGPGIKGIATDEWPESSGFSSHVAKDVASDKAALLKLWDQSTEEIKTYWPAISAARFQENTVVFGMYEGQIFSSILYFIDNETHHRAQGTVYLRSLGIEPPAFWNRE